jgi:hypothetical protein
MRTHERTTGIALIALAVALAGAGASYVFATKEAVLALDGDQCPRSPTGASLAVVDRTDLWPLIEQERIRKSILGIAERMRKHERLVLFTITARSEDASTPWRAFQRCKSADPNGVNPATGNWKMEQADYEREFLTPLNQVLPDLLKGRSAPQSPILEVLELLMWSPHFRGNLTKRTLAIHSDLLQHTPALSHLSGSLRSACAVLASPIGERLKGHDWRGVRVILEYLRNGRDAARQGREHFKFWVELFYRLGAAEVFDGATLMPNHFNACAVDQPQRAKPRRSSNAASISWR